MQPLIQPGHKPGRKPDLRKEVLRESGLLLPFDRPSGVQSPEIISAPQCSNCRQPLPDEYSHGWMKARDASGNEVWETGPLSTGAIGLKVKWIPCPVCAPPAIANRRRRDRDAMLARAFGGSNIPPKFQKYTFASYPEEGDQDACARLEAYADGLLNKLVYVWGERGHGKTGLATSAAAVFMERGEQVLYMRSPEFFQRVREQKYNKKLNGQDVNIMDLAYGCKLFILDDLGVERPTYEVAVNLYNFLEERVNNQDLYTIITSNKSIKKLAHSFHLDSEDDDTQPGYRIAERIAENFDRIKIAGTKLRNVIDALNDDE